jgi:uncharacterized membrane protein (TIGR02234 family)
VEPRARRELAVGVGLCLAGAALVLLAAGRPWLRGVVDPGAPLAPETVALAGSDVAPGTPALGLLGLAGVAALLATRRTGRVAVGVLLALAGAALVALAVGAASGDRVAALASARNAATVTTAAGTAWPWAAAAGGVLVAGAGVLAAVRGRSWAALSARYDAPGATAPARAPRPRDPDAAAWDALDRGEDPTT